jgi:hypothetical protein
VADGLMILAPIAFSPPAGRTAWGHSPAAIPLCSVKIYQVANFSVKRKFAKTELFAICEQELCQTGVAGRVNGEETANN